MGLGDSPVTDNYPLQLHYIKALFLQKQYRQCIHACRDVLKDGGEGVGQRAVQQTFIRFYLGLAHDELARLMHDQSQAKIPAFTQAEQCYKEALELLPAVLAEAHIDEDSQSDDPFVDSSPPQATTSTSRNDDHEYDPFNFSTPSYPQMPAMSPPTHVRTDSLPTRSPQAASRETSSSDLESHASFEQIMTPNKALQRDVSRMSLLDEAPRRPGLSGSLLRTTSGALPRTTSGPLVRPDTTAQGLMRPIRPGSPPTSFFLPPRLPYVRSAATNSKLPKLVTHSIPEYSPSRSLPSFNRGGEHSPYSPSPVSPLGSDAGFSDTDTISPISPETPVRDRDFVATATPAFVDQAEPEENDGILDIHVEAMRTQLLTHLHMLEAAKERTISAQATRAAERASAAPTTGTPLTPFRASVGGAASSNSRPGSSSSSKHDSVLGASKIESTPATSKRMPQSRSYWSFTPEDVKAQELRKRVERGRERGWAKERFRPERYRALAEQALAEL